MTFNINEYVDDKSLRAEASILEVAEAFLERIQDRKDLNAVVEVAHDRVAQDIDRAQKARDSGAPLPLDGLPILVKDNIDVEGVRCGVGSPLFEGRVSETDATVVRLLSDAGAVILGKTSLHELAFGGTTDSQFYGRTKNPWDLDRIVGGSSGGSGAAVAAGLCVVALGSDTGGSIRVPASVNGVVGHRPSFGTVSVHGSVAIGPSLDTIGPIARWASDAALVHSLLSGRDWLDPYSGDVPLPPAGPFLRVGRVSDASIGDVQPGVLQCVDAAVQALKELGARVQEIDLPDFLPSQRSAARMIQIEAWARYRRDLQRSPEKFSRETTERLRLGEGATGSEYVEAEWFVRDWRSLVQRLLAYEVDLLVLPSVPVIAPVAGTSGMVTATALMTALTLPISAAHIPAVSIPFGTSEGMPVGVQLAAAPGRDLELLALADRLQLFEPPLWPSHRGVSAHYESHER